MLSKQMIAQRRRASYYARTADDSKPVLTEEQQAEIRKLIEDNLRKNVSTVVGGVAYPGGLYR